MSVARSDAKNKPVVARAVAEVINAGNLDAVDELYAPAIAAAVKSWVAPFRKPPDHHLVGTGGQRGPAATTRAA